MSCDVLYDGAKPLPCSICEKAPQYVVWQKINGNGEIHRIACHRCGKIINGRTKEHAIVRWNKLVLQTLYSYGERREGE